MPRYLPLLVRIDALLHFLTRGRVGFLRLAGIPGITMTIIGRKSGIPRRTNVLAAPDGRGWLVAGSYFGGDKTPAWVFNLRAAETLTVEVNGVSSTMVATELSGDDRSRAWATLLSVWPNFTLYEQRTKRVIPLFRLSP